MITGDQGDSSILCQKGSSRCKWRITGADRTVRTPSGRIGWVQLTHAPNLNATADRDGITIETKGDVTFRIAASGIAVPSITAKQWNLPGMPIAVQSDGAFSSHPAGSSEAPNAVDITYSGVSRIRLQLRDSGR